MAERKAVNKYYPPDWTPSKGGLNKFRGQHPLRERARKLKDGILIVRFEMPFNIWCNGCQAHIGKGVRYNAEKKQNGNYFSTKIWNFQMKCHLCSGIIEIETDPQNRDYKIVSGAKRKEENWKPDADSGMVVLPDEEESKKLAQDPFYRLEQANIDRQKAKESEPLIEELQKVQEKKKDDYSLSCTLRKRFREEKKSAAKLKDEGLKKGLNFSLLPRSSDDLEELKQVEFRKSSTPQSLINHSKLKSDSIFGKQSSNKEKKRKQFLHLLSVTQSKVPKTDSFTNILQHKFVG